MRLDCGTRPLGSLRLPPREPPPCGYWGDYSRGASAAPVLPSPLRGTGERRGRKRTEALPSLWSSLRSGPRSRGVSLLRHRLRFATPRELRLRPRGRWLFLSIPRGTLPLGLPFPAASPQVGIRDPRFEQGYDAHQLCRRRRRANASLPTPRFLPTQRSDRPDSRRESQKGRLNRSTRPAACPNDRTIQPSHELP
jgi:hypothetical protein